MLARLLLQHAGRGRPQILRGRFAIVAFEHSSPAIHYGASRMRRLKYWLVSQTYRRHDAVVGVSEA